MKATEIVQKITKMESDIYIVLEHIINIINKRENNKWYYVEKEFGWDIYECYLDSVVEKVKSELNACIDDIELRELVEKALKLIEEYEKFNNMEEVK